MPETGITMMLVSNGCSAWDMRQKWNAKTAQIFTWCVAVFEFGCILQDMPKKDIITKVLRVCQKHAICGICDEVLKFETFVMSFDKEAMPELTLYAEEKYAGKTLLVCPMDALSC